MNEMVMFLTVRKASVAHWELGWLCGQASMKPGFQVQFCPLLLCGLGCVPFPLWISSSECNKESGVAKYKEDWLESGR